MADNDGIYVRFGAKLDELNQGLGQATNAVKSTVGEIESQIAQLNQGFGLITKTFAAFTAVLAGGSTLKAFIDGSIEMTKEAVTLGKSLGMTTTEASYFSDALTAVGVSQETVTMASSKITMSLLKNEDAFKKLGVTTRDSNGNFRSTTEIMMATNEKLRGFKEGTDRNIEGMKIYGRSWSEVSGMVSKFTGVTEESRQGTEALNQVVGEEAVANMKRYKLAQIEVNDVMEGVGNTIGQYMIPRLAEMGEWFASMGPDAVSATRVAMEGYLTVQDSIKDSILAVWNVLSTTVGQIARIFGDAFGPGGKAVTPMEFFMNVVKVVQVAFIGFRIGIQEVAEVVIGVIDQLIIGMRGFAEMAVAAFHLDWDGVKNAWNKMGADAEKSLANTMAKMAGIAEKGREDIDTAIFKDMGASSKVTATKIKEGGTTSSGSDSDDKAAAKAKSRMSLFEAELMASKERYMIENNMVEMSKQQEIAAWDSVASRYKLTQEERNGIAKEVATLRLDILKTNAAQEKELTLQSIEEEKSLKLEMLAYDAVQADESVALGRMTALERLAVERKYEEARHEINKNALIQRLTLLEKDPSHNVVEMKRIKDELLNLEIKHMTDVAKLNSSVTIEQSKSQMNFFNTLKNSYGEVIEGMLMQTNRLSTLLRTAYKQMASSFIQEFIVKRTEAMIMNYAKELAMKNSFVAMMLGMDVASSSATVGIKAVEADAVISANAAEAASGAASSQASIPYVGPILAASAFAAMMALVMGSKSGIKSARGGYDIPSGVNPMVQTHEEEMILPKEQANAIRNMTGSGGGMNITIHAVDAAGVKKLFMDHGSSLVASLKNQNRNFATK